MAVMTRVRSALRRRLTERLARELAAALPAPAAPPAPEADRAFFLAAARLCDRATGAAPPPHSLAAAELRVSSQNGEDGVLQEILRRTGTAAEPCFVEFGVESGAEGTCVFLADVLGWRGAFLEANPELHARLARKYAATPRVRTHLAHVTPANVEALFAELGVPAEPDVVSIDVDGVDYWIWRALHGHRPRVLVVEYNAALPDGEARVVPEDFAGWGGDDRFGASLTALERLGAAKGYRLVHTDLTGVNAFFVREDLAAAFPEPPLRRGVNYLLASYGHPRAADGAWVIDPPT